MQPQWTKENEIFSTPVALLSHQERLHQPNQCFTPHLITIFGYSCDKSNLLISREMCHTPSHQESLTSLLWLSDLGPELKLGPSHMLQVLCSKPSKLAESLKAKKAFCSNRDMESRRITSLTVASEWCLPSGKVSLRRKVDLTLSEYTICFEANTSRWRTYRFRTSRRKYTGTGKRTVWRNLRYIWAIVIKTSRVCTSLYVRWTTYHYTERNKRPCQRSGTYDE